MRASSDSTEHGTREPDDGLRSACSAGEAVRWAVPQLREVTPSPRLEAELLLVQLLDRSRVYLLAHPEITLTTTQVETYTALVRRRASGEPLPYLTGRAEFFGLEFTLTPDVLIPRPETEVLVEEALAWLRANRAETVADVGTGSGCIVVALAVHAPTLRCYATDTSRAALAVARANAERHAVAERVTFLEGDLLAPLPEAVDLIVSNPPYVGEDEWEALPPSVRREPRSALLSGSDGLDALRRLLQQAPAHLRPGGRMLVEIGERHGKAAQALARAAFPDADVRILPDLAGKDRALSVIGARSQSVASL
jgi:release factor glutamine methyltransferase